MSRTLSVFATAAFALSVVGCSGPSTPAPAPAPPVAAPVAPVVVTLPEPVAFPEGIAYDAAADALYTGGAVDGALVRVNAATGESTIVTPGGRLVPANNETFPAVLGMKIDGTKRLWIAGGRTGRIWVVDTANGAIVKDAAVATAGKSLINDVALIGASGYFTDTFVPTLWRVTADGNNIGNPEPWLDLSGSVIEYADGIANLNGIVATPDGRTLIVVHMGKGLLFKIDVATKVVTAIGTGGADLTGADGLVLDGRSLYVVRQTAAEIATVHLAEDLSSGTVTSRFAGQGLAWPATAAKVGDHLIVVNTQFNTRADNTTTRPFTLLRVPVSRLGQ